jgi:hypothetical protein
MTKCGKTVAQRQDTGLTEEICVKQESPGNEAKRYCMKMKNENKNKMVTIMIKIMDFLLTDDVNRRSVTKASRFTPEPSISRRLESYIRVTD